MAGTNLPPLRPGTLDQQKTAKSTGSCDPRMPNVRVCIEPRPKAGGEGGQKAVYGFLLQELQPLFLEMGKLNVAVHGVREELHLMCAELQQIREVMDQKGDAQEEFIHIANPRPSSPATPAAMKAFENQY